MKNTLKLMSVLSMSVMLLASCEKLADNYGRPVIFSSSQSSQVTKATYGDYDASIHHQDINWKPGDELRVFSAEALDPNNKPFADYRITGEGSTSGITPCTEDVDLRWGNPDDKGKYNFYSIYPLPSDSKDIVTVSMNSYFASGDIYGDQTPASADVTKDDDGNFTVGTNLPKYMMMVANKSVSDNNTTVNLDFRPLTTVIQFTIQNGTGEDLPIYGLELRSKSTAMPLSGPFTLNIGTLDTDGYEICRYSAESVATENCRVKMKLDDVSLAVGKSITFTFFLHPSVDLSDLTLGLYRTATWCRYTTIQHTDGTGVTFRKHMKTIVDGLCLPAGMKWTMAVDGQLKSWTVNSSELLDFEE